MENFKQKLTRIKTLLFDVDGVLTNGQVFLMESGEFVRNMNSKDGYALQLAVKKGYRIIVISGSASDEAVNRLKRLGIADVFMKVVNKKAKLEEYILHHHLNHAEVLFMGDDIPDIEVMKSAGLACCPADAVEEIKAISAYISPVNGGFGCCRDVIEKVLKLKNDWNEDVTITSS